APVVPYRPDARAPWRRGDAPLVELPIAVARALRVPLIGTSIVLLPPRVRERLLAGARGRQVFNLELHGIDLLAGDQDQIPAELVARQPDLRRPLADKWRALESTLAGLAVDYQFVTLAAAAAELTHRLEPAA